jgi:hypothetical protein
MCVPVPLDFCVIVRESLTSTLSLSLSLVGDMVDRQRWYLDVFGTGRDQKKRGAIDSGEIIKQCKLCCRSGFIAVSDEMLRPIGLA